MPLSSLLDLPVPPNPGQADNVFNYLATWRLSPNVEGFQISNVDKFLKTSGGICY